MTSAHPAHSIFIIYQHGLFAQGLRSLLGRRRTVQILGMESDVAKALKTVRSLKPEVIIIEESARKGPQSCLDTLLDQASTGRVVTLSLSHQFAMIYNKNRVARPSPADLVKAIHGTRIRHQLVRPGQPQS